MQSVRRVLHMQQQQQQQHVLRLASSVHFMNGPLSSSSHHHHHHQIQVRTYAKKPLFLRGKRGFRYYEKLKRVKGMSDMARQEYMRQKERTKGILWEPETEVERYYVEMMMDMQKTRRKIGERAIIRLLDMCESESDLQFVLRIYRLMRIRNTRFSTDLTTKMVETFERMGDFEAVKWILKHPVQLDLPPKRATVHHVMQQLAEKEEYDDLLSLYENISRGKYMLKLTDEDVTFTTSLLIEAEQYDKVIDAYNTKIKRRYREHSGQMAQGYHNLLKACAETENLETAAKVRADMLANTTESDETKQAILAEFSDLMAKVDEAANEGEAQEEMKEE